MQTLGRAVIRYKQGPAKLSSPAEPVNPTARERKVQRELALGISAEGQGAGSVARRRGARRDTLMPLTSDILVTSNLSLQWATPGCKYGKRGSTSTRL